MAWYPQAIRKNIPPPASDPRITARVAILHVADSEGPSLFGYFNGNSGGVESHFYIRYDGVIEQYRDTAYQADANVAANDFAISIETEGKASGKWTEAQLASIKALLLWLNLTHSIPLVVCPKWNGSGVGYHILFEDKWDGRNASCPGPNRIIQFKNVLVPWMASGGKEADVPLSDDDVKKIWAYPGLVSGRTVWGEVVTGTDRAQKALDAVNALTTDAIAAAVVVKLPASSGGQVDIAAVAKATVDELARRGLTLQVNGSA